MNNIEITNKGGKLIITVDVSEKSVKSAAISASGKSRVIASTHGNVNVGDGLTLGLNLYTKVAK